MASSARKQTAGRQRKWSFAPFAALLVTLLFMGGMSRYTAGLPFVLRPLLVLIGAGLMLLPRRSLGHSVQVPFTFLASLAIVIGAQLIPLPPAWWMSLPGRTGYADVARWLDQPQPWRPISLVPILTWNSLLALLPATVMIIAVSRLDRRHLGTIVVALLCAGAFSALLGVVQIGSGSSGWGYLYQNFSEGLPTGAFSNRNHQAAFLASLLPFLAIWAGYPSKTTIGMIPGTTRQIMAGIGATLFTATVLITGSRSGLALLVLNLAVSAVMLVAASAQPGARRRRIIAIAGVAAVLLLLVAGAVLLDRGGGISRLAALDPGSEMRVRAFSLLRHLVSLYLPWGSGFGTFDPLFRMYEPDALLKPTFFNNAHNDALELAITGGLPALLLLASFIVWLSWRLAAIMRTWRRDIEDRSAAIALAGGLMTVTWLIGSLSDYPLRTPLASAMFALGCCLAALQRVRT